jgi:hypothetical protein
VSRENDRISLTCAEARKGFRRIKELENKTKLDRVRVTSRSSRNLRCAHSSIRAPKAHEAQFALGAAIGDYRPETGRSIRGSGTFSLRTVRADRSGDTTTEELGVIDLIPYHYIRVDQDVARHRHFGSRTVPPVQ